MQGILADSKSPSWWWIDLLGCLLMGYGFFISSLADYQKSSWKAKHGDTLCTNGLYKKSRHPNYGGELMFFVGYFLRSQFDLASFLTLFFKLFIMKQAASRLDGEQEKKYGEKFNEWKKIAKRPFL
jgi:steroid 5-alpha reductase family enzyme